MTEPKPKMMQRDDVIEVLRHPEKYTPEYVEEINRAQLWTTEPYGVWLRFTATHSAHGWIAHWDKRIIDKWAALSRARGLTVTVTDRLSEVPA